MLLISNEQHQHQDHDVDGDDFHRVSIDADIDGNTNIIMILMIFIEVLISSLVQTSIQYLFRPDLKSAADIDADVNDFSQKY